MEYKNELSIKIFDLYHNLTIEDVKRILEKKYKVSITIDSDWVIVKYNKEQYDFGNFIKSLQEIGNLEIHFGKPNTKRPMCLYSE